MKKLVSLALALVMLLCVAGTAMAYSPAEPITILFWHTRGSGANYDACKASVDAFNSTVGAEKGIIVEEVYIGNYTDLWNKAALATQSGEQPVVCVVGNTAVAMMIDDGLLADMAPYAADSGFDTSNILDCFMTTVGNTDGQLHSLPYVRSTPLFYYNKTLADAKQLTPPETVEEMIEFCKALYTVNDKGEVETYGFLMFNDYGYYQASFLWQLGEPMLAEDFSSPAMEGTSMLKQLSDWRAWVDEGWCRAFDSTNAGATAKELFFQGKLAAYLDSTGSMKNNITQMTANNFEIGVAPFPTYDVDKKAAEIGGGNIALIGKGNTDEQLAAGWEFLQFLMTDEQVFLNSSGSGYLPVTKSVSSYQPMLDFWAANPTYKIAYDQLSFAIPQEFPYHPDLQEVIVNIQEAVSLLIQERSITPEEAVQMIKDNCAHLI